jgi:hypothetical protein
MRSSWVLPFLHRTAMGGLIAHSPQGRQTVLSPQEKGASHSRAQVPTWPAHPRFCLGIGDGTMRRQ